jgi:hypothetical protein
MPFEVLYLTRDRRLRQESESAERNMMTGAEPRVPFGTVGVSLRRIGAKSISNG